MSLCLLYVVVQVYPGPNLLWSFLVPSSTPLWHVPAELFIYYGGYRFTVLTKSNTYSLQGYPLNTPEPCLCGWESFPAPCSWVRGVTSHYWFFLSALVGSRDLAVFQHYLLVEDPPNSLCSVLCQLGHRDKSDGRWGRVPTNMCHVFWHPGIADHLPAASSTSEFIQTNDSSTLTKKQLNDLIWSSPGWGGIRQQRFSPEHPS